MKSLNTKKILFYAVLFIAAPLIGSAQNNSDNSIDKIASIEASKSNFQVNNHSNEDEGMVFQIIKLKSDLSEEELIKKARERQPRFKALPGLLQKYYVKLIEPGQYAGVYIWDSKESMMAYSESDLAASIPAAYKLVGPPSIEIGDLLFKLRE